MLDAELEAVLLSKASQFGLPAEWVARLDRLDAERRQVRYRRRRGADCTAWTRLYCLGWSVLLGLVRTAWAGPYCLGWSVLLRLVCTAWSCL